jgi:ketosteroid isomerase-like protein
MACARILVSVCVLGATIVSIAWAQPAIDAATVEQWLAGYEAAWENKDAAAAAALFTADARYQETPYSEPFRGREGIADYWANVTADQRDIDFEFEVLAVDGRTGVASWSAVFAVGPAGDRVELNGVFVLEFAPQGLCAELREWWHAR